MNDADDSWLKPDKPSYQSFYLTLFASVILIAVILIFAGAPIQDPSLFLMILAVVCSVGLICSLLNREISRGLGFKGSGRDTPV